jgi:hypothetical protein
MYKVDFQKKWASFILSFLLIFSLAVSIVPQTVLAESAGSYQKIITGESGNQINMAIFRVAPSKIEVAVADVPEAHIAGVINTLSNVPAFYWSYGCAPTSAAMLFGYYDSTGCSRVNQRPPNAPSDLIATPISSSKINLTWQDNSDNEAGFKIERKTGSGSYFQIATVRPGVTSYSNTRLSASTTYYYRVRAYNAAGNSNYSNEASATTLPPPPAAPTLKSPASRSTVPTLTPRLEWNVSSGAVSYGVQVSTSSSFTNLLVNETGITNLYCDIAPGTLHWNTTYYWRVNTRNSFGTSSWSKYWYFKTSRTPPRVTLTISSTAGGNVTTPGEGTFTYWAGTVVSLNATPDAGYRFGNWTGDVDTVANVNAAATNITINGNYCITANFQANFMVSGGDFHTVGLKSDGTVVAVGRNSEGQCNVGSWTDIIQIAAGEYHTVGLKSDGTVVAVGLNDDGQCDVGSWTDIVQVAAGFCYTVGLKSDGTVVAVGRSSEGQCNVGGWTDIIQVAAGWYHTVGLKSDGTVVAVGLNDDGQCDVGGWTDITQVAARSGHTVGLKADGTVVAVGLNDYGQCNIGSWTDIIQVAGNGYHTVGLTSDGTVVAVGLNDEGQCNVGGWTGITQVTAGDFHTVGLTSNGTVVAVGRNSEGQCDVGGWTLIV